MSYIPRTPRGMCPVGIPRILSLAVALAAAPQVMRLPLTKPAGRGILALVGQSENTTTSRVGLVEFAAAVLTPNWPALPHGSKLGFYIHKASISDFVPSWRP